MTDGVPRPDLKGTWSHDHLSSVLAWFQGYFRTPLVRNGYALIASTGVTSILGLVYWLLAARLYSLTEIGLNSALISTMLAVGGIAQLNLGSVLTRFLPGLGRRTSQRLVLAAYGAGLLAALICCFLFFLGINAWAPSLALLTTNPPLMIWFTAATMIWTVFALQDGALAGLRRAIWVPVENTAFALAKIALLVILADSEWRAWGPFASWTLPLLLAVAPVNFFLFWRLMPANDSAVASQRPVFDKRLFVRYFAADFLGTSLLVVAIGLAPILVMEHVGPEGIAVYYLSWTIAYSLYLVSKSMGISLVAEGAADPWRSRSFAIDAFVHTSGLLIVAVAVLLVIAPSLLALFGPEYAAGDGLLRVLCLSALPFGVTSMVLGLARVEGHLTAIIVIHAALTLLVLALGVPLLNLLGTFGMGLAWLIAQTIVAILLCIFVWRTTGFSRVAINALHNGTLNGALPAYLAPFQRRSLQWATAMLVKKATSGLANYSTAGVSPSESGLTATKNLHTLCLGHQGGQGLLRMKTARTSEGALDLRRESEILRTLHADPRLGEFRPLIPRVVSEGSTYIVERQEPGSSGLIILSDDRLTGKALMSAGAVINGLHDRTAAYGTIAEPWLTDWIDRPISMIGASVPDSDGKLRAALAAIQCALRSSWDGRTLWLGLSHGSLGPAQIGFAQDASCVTAIVDWSRMRFDGPGAFDPCCLVLTTRMLTSGHRMSEAVCELLRQPQWRPDEKECFAASSLPLMGSETRMVALLAWLHYCAERIAECGDNAGYCQAGILQIEETLRFIQSNP